MATAAQEYPTKQSDDFGVILGNTVKLLGISWRAFLLNLTTFLVVYVLPVILVLVATMAALGVAGIEIQDDKLTTNSLNVVGAAAAVVVAVAVIVMAIIANIASIITQLSSARGVVISPKDALEKSLPYFWRSIVLGILCVAIVLVGFLLLIVPGFVALFFLSLVGYVLIDKNCSPTEAISECYRLVKQNWKVVLAYVVVLIGIQVISSITFVGALAGMGLSIAYLCLPAILYIRIQKQNPVKTAKK